MLKGHRYGWAGHVGHLAPAQPDPLIAITDMTQMHQVNRNPLLMTTSWRRRLRPASSAATGWRQSCVFLDLTDHGLTDASAITDRVDRRTFEPEDSGLSGALKALREAR